LSDEDIIHILEKDISNIAKSLGRCNKLLRYFNSYESKTKICDILGIDPNIAEIMKKEEVQLEAEKKDEV
jgi:hypothetical protein